jgi:nitric oxide synthase-interacting protein
LKIFCSLLCSPQGHLFDKECIYEALLHQKKALKRQRRLWEEQQMKLKEEEIAKERAKQTELLNVFEKTENSLLPTTTNATTTSTSSSSSLSSSLKSRVSSSETMSKVTTGLLPDGPPPRPSQLAQNTEERATQISAYWVPALTPSAPPTLIPKPPKTTYCLEGNHPLTLKELIPVHFTLVPNSTTSDKQTNRNSSREKTEETNDESLQEEYMCPLCAKTLNNVLRAVLMRGCGHVLCVHCTQKFVVSSKACAVCNEPCPSESDRIPLQTGGTGYAGHDQERLQAVKKTPAPWI